MRPFQHLALALLAVVSYVGSANAQNASHVSTILYWTNYYASLYKIPAKKWNNTLWQDAVACGRQNKGVSEQHCLPPNTVVGQIIQPGKGIDETTGYTYSPFENFEAAYLDFLCAVPNSPPIAKNCSQVVPITQMEYYSNGTYTIATDPQYTQIGCAFTQNSNSTPNDTWQGIWVCNFTP